MICSKVINQIIRFRRACKDERVSKKLAGDIGEYYVLQKLNDLGYKDIEHRSGHSSYDIYLRDVDKRIEVRTSLYKDEGLYKGISYFGWRIKTRAQKKDNKFDVLACVALSKDFTKATFYIFTYEEAYQVEDIPKGRFSNVQKKIHLFRTVSAMKKAIKLKPVFITTTERKINRNRDQYKNKWSKLKL